MKLLRLPPGCTRAALATVLALTLFTPVRSAPAPASVPTVIILDSSGSMRGRIRGEAKIDIAKRVVRDLVGTLPEGTTLGLVAYGHRRGNDCADIELLIPPGPLERAKFIQAVEKMQPRGMTPLSGSLTFAAQAVDHRRQPAHLILVSDGVETCGQDPCATARRLKQEAPQLTVHTVAFDLSAREARSIACIATATGGRFLQANDAASLQDALELVVVEATQPPPPPPPPTPTAATKAPEPPAERLTPATITVPPEVVVGATFAAEWTGPDNPQDYLTVVPQGTPDQLYENLGYTRRGSPLELTAPIEPGEVEVRYVTGQSRTILARAPMRVVDARVTLEAAPEIVAGARLAVTWAGPANTGDYLTIVPAAAPDGDYAGYTDTRAGSPLEVTAPLDPGPAEIRYMSGQGRKVLARRPVTVVAAEVTLEAPPEAGAGSRVAIQWTGPDNQGDYITIVRAGTPDGQYAGYADTRTGSPLEVTAPIEPGDAEIRYMTSAGRRVLARRPLRILATAVNLEAPAEAVAGSRVPIQWTGPNNQGDYITIVRAGTADGQYAGYTDTRVGSPLEVTTPIEAGEAEIRYMSGQGRKVLARRPLRVVAATITLDAPEQAVVGSVVRVNWTGPNNTSDYLTIVPVGAADSAYAGYADTKAGSPALVTAGLTPGAMEIRYVSGQGKKVLARRALQLTAAEVRLEVPQSAPAGSTVTINWVGPNNTGDYLTIVPKSTPDGTSGNYAYTRAGSPLNVPAPPAAGAAEVRYMAGQGNKVMARVEIDLTAP